MHEKRNNMTAFTSVQRKALGALTIIAGATLVTLPAHAQNYPVTSAQRATAQQVSERGIPVAELATNAPDVYTVKRGDTLWGISGMYLKRPWRWPELWGMNIKEISNPHLIYPGQNLYLDKDGAYARLRTSRAGEPETLRISPRTRSESLADLALPTLKPHLIEPFLVEPLVVDADELKRAPRVIATTEERVLMASGDRVYVRGDGQSATLRAEPGEPRHYRVFRDAVALKDPLTSEILGYEAQYLGKAELVRGESFEEVANAKGGATVEYVPATVDLSAVREEIRAGDRLLPAPARAYTSYMPRAPQFDVDARIVSLYGSTAVAFAAQNQVVAINLGTQDGIEPGHVLSLMTKGDRVMDTTDGGRTMVKLPSESNGKAMVFRTFDRVSYVLLLEVRNSVRVGDRMVNPR
jgi:hypothetical protein